MKNFFFFFLAGIRTNIKKWGPFFLQIFCIFFFFQNFLSATTVEVPCVQNSSAEESTTRKVAKTLLLGLLTSFLIWLELNSTTNKVHYFIMFQFHWSDIHLNCHIELSSTMKKKKKISPLVLLLYLRSRNPDAPKSPNVTTSIPPGPHLEKERFLTFFSVSVIFRFHWKVKTTGFRGFYYYFFYFVSHLFCPADSWG